MCHTQKTHPLTVAQQPPFWELLSSRSIVKQLQFALQVLQTVRLVCCLMRILVLIIAAGMFFAHLIGT
jgi:hypothetical protein